MFKYRFVPEYYFNDGEGGSGGSNAGDPNEGEAKPELPSGSPDGETTADAGNWPDNWRQLYSGEDDKKLSALSRYASPDAAFDGLLASKQKISSGEYKSTEPYPEKGTDDEKLSWREENGIPGKYEEYSFKREIPKEEQAYVEELKKYAHKNNIPSAHTESFLNFMYEQESSGSDQDKQLDEQARQDTEDKLRLEWGADYRRNLNVINSLFDTAPEGLKESIMGGRSPDGNQISSNIDAMRYFADLALKINPMSTVVNVSGGNYASTIDDEITKIEKTMGTREYFRDEKSQARLRDLYAARDGQKAG
jgi:hypothetical protein